MASQPLSFIHAGDLRLDEAFREAGPAADETRHTFEDCTFAAFDNLVDAAIERDVDFVLIAGDCFASAPSLRAKAELRDGFRELAEYNIPVLIVCAGSTSIEWCREIKDLPKNVTIADEWQRDRMPIYRDGHEIAAVSVERLGHEKAHTQTANKPAAPQTAHSPFTIAAAIGSGTMRVDELDAASLDRLVYHYVAQCGGTTRRTVTHHARVAHAAGSLQGLERGETGTHGCTLVAVDAQGAIESKFIGTSTVRRESLSLEIKPHMSRGDLLSSMRESLSALRHAACEMLWQIEWSLRGSGPLFDSLYEERAHDELIASLSNSSQPGDDLECLHVLHLAPDRVQLAEQVSKQGGLGQEYFERLGQFAPIDRAYVTGLLNETFRVDGPAADDAWKKRLHAVAAQVDCERVIARASRLGAGWFDEAK